MRKELEFEIAALILKYEKEGGNSFHHIKVESFSSVEEGHVVYVEIVED